MSDLISRQAAIDLWEKYHPTIAVDAMQYDAELRQLPPASCSEFPNNSDTISRQAAIDALKGLPTWWADEGGYYGGAQAPMVALLDPEDAVSAIENLPSAQPEQRWIPCSERLPEEKERSYWVCLETGGQCQCRWTNDMYGLGANKWSKWGWHIMDKPQYSKIVAWMPLPEPYKGEQE